MMFFWCFLFGLVWLVVGFWWCFVLLFCWGLFFVLFLFVLLLLLFVSVVVKLHATSQGSITGAVSKPLFCINPSIAAE